MSEQHIEPGVSRRVVSIAISGTVVLGLGAAVLSFTALTDLAVRAGVPSGLGFVWPIIVDGLIVVSTIAVVAAAGPAHRGVRRYAWALLALGAGVSVLANGAHAIVAAHASTPRLMAVAVASVPPIVLLAVTHLTALLARRTPSQSTEQALVAAAVESVPEPDPERDKALVPVLEASRAAEWFTGPVAGPFVGTTQLRPEPQRAHAQSSDTLAQAVAHAQMISPEPGPVTDEVAMRVEAPAAAPTASEPASADDFRDWVAAQVRVGAPVTGRTAVDAGLVGSVRTGTRRIAALRDEDPDLFDSRVLRAVRGA